MARCGKINKQTLWYALYQGVNEIIDENGDYTGDYKVEYSTPIQAKMSISPSRGTADVECFGINIQYTKTLETDDMGTPFDTDTIFWIGVTPKETYTVNGIKNTVDVPHNYVVSGVARGLPRSGTCKIAIKEVDVDV